MPTELVHINTTNGLIKIVTAEGVKNEQQTSLDAALAKVAEYIDRGYEVISSSSTGYVLKKPDEPKREIGRITLEK